MNRKEAIDQGADTFDGETCEANVDHAGLRFVIGGACVACKSATGAPFAEQSVERDETAEWKTPSLWMKLKAQSMEELAALQLMKIPGWSQHLGELVRVVAAWRAATGNHKLRVKGLRTDGSTIYDAGPVCAWKSTINDLVEKISWATEHARTADMYCRLPEGYANEVRATYAAADQSLKWDCPLGYAPVPEVLTALGFGSIGALRSVHPSLTDYDLSQWGVIRLLPLKGAPI